jgi:hypothetical protein
MIIYIQQASIGMGAGPMPGADFGGHRYMGRSLRNWPRIPSPDRNNRPATMQIQALFKKSAPAPKKAAKKAPKVGKTSRGGWFGGSDAPALDKWYGEQWEGCQQCPYCARERTEHSSFWTRGRLQCRVGI